MRRTEESGRGEGVVGLDYKRSFWKGEHRERLKRVAVVGRWKSNRQVLLIVYWMGRKEDGRE